MITHKRRPNYHEKRLIRANAVEEDSVVLLFKAMDRMLLRLSSSFYNNENSDFESENDKSNNHSPTAIQIQSQHRKMSGIILAGLKVNNKYSKRKTSHKFIHNNS
jgi:hypothetical protein